MCAFPVSPRTVKNAGRLPALRDPIFPCASGRRDLRCRPMNRRDFLAQASLALAAAAIPNTIAPAVNAASRGSALMPSPSAASPVPSQDLDFASALQAAEAIRKKQISSLELTERMFARIDRYNPQLNAFVYQLREDALAQAKKSRRSASQRKVSRRLPWRSSQCEGKFRSCGTSGHLGHSRIQGFESACGLRCGGASARRRRDSSRRDECAGRPGRLAVLQSDLRHNK
jgi:hypothetical protein